MLSSEEENLGVGPTKTGKSALAALLLNRTVFYGMNQGGINVH